MRLRNGLRNGAEERVPGRFVKLLTVGILILLIQSCTASNPNVDIDTTGVRIQQFNEVEFWCLEKTDFTAILQEADRCLFE